MKSNISIFALLTSLASYACPDITGKYLCPAESEEPTAFESRTIQFKKSPYIDIYSMQLGGESLVFEVGAWNPGINVNSGDVNQSLETIAECQGEKVILSMKQTVTDNDLSVSVTSSLDVLKISEGINLTLKLEGEEIHQFDCIKQ